MNFKDLLLQAKAGDDNRITDDVPAASFERVYCGRHI